MFTPYFITIIGIYILLLVAYGYFQHKLNYFNGQLEDVIARRLQLLPNATLHSILHTEENIYRKCIKTATRWRRLLLALLLFLLLVILFSPAPLLFTSLRGL